MKYVEIENNLNQFDDWDIEVISDDGRRNSQYAEDEICKKINERLNISKTKTHNRESSDLYLLEGEDLKIVEPDNFTNTISPLKLSKMLNLKGGNMNTVFDSYIDKKQRGEIKLVEDYVIIYLNKKTKKFTICKITELPKECIAVNPSNGIQTKIPTSLVNRTNEEKFELVHNLFVEYINKRILNPAKKWETVING
jgi:predicted component of viral defense system (DUF524 family)